MINPLIKRIPREFKSDFGKYAVIFLFMLMLISIVSGFLVADNSIYDAYNKGFEKYNIENGHITFNKELNDELLAEIEEKGDIKLYDLRYFEEDSDSEGKTSRVYIDREFVNTECIMEGRMPEADNEIVIDRMFASNNKIKVGDTITLNKKALTITGFAAFPDYSSLFESSTDMMFDAINFNVAVMTESGFNSVASKHISYNYAWKYNEKFDRKDSVKAQEMSDKLIDVLKDVVTEYDEEIVNKQLSALSESETAEDYAMLLNKSADTDIMAYIDKSEIIEITDFLPQYLNQAINFTGEDMGGDKAFFILFDYIVIAVLAFIFAVTTSNTIASEAGVIGTLRASGYSRGELIRHYLVLPVLITLIAAVIGNILGYTVFKDVMANFYYNSYSLPTYVVLWNAEAFVNTTVIPLILMIIINFAVISTKMNLTPLQFLRRELKKKPGKKAFRLNTKIPFAERFRLRILFQNIPGYIVMIFGIILGACIIIFGEIFGTIFKDYKADVLDSMICDYQYILTEPQETEYDNAEKYCMTSFEFKFEDYANDNISVYGVSDNSKYIDAEITGGKTAISSTINAKYGIEIGDTITLTDKYSKNKSYEFTVDSIYDYDASLTVFISRENFNKTFSEDSDYFTGYFSDQKIDDINTDYVAGIITETDYTKVSEQMEHSMGGMMKLIKYFGVIMFVLIMYILSKQVIEKNFQSISMCKILGFKNGEIGMLYILSTSIAVLIGLLVSIPITDMILRWAFSSYLYKVVSGYFPYNVRTSSFVLMLILGIASYCAVAVLQFIKISRIPKSEALKNVE